MVHPLTRGDLNYWKIADILHTLMTEVLGYEKYGSLGSDYGALVTSALGHTYADSLVALHFGHDLPPGLFQHDRYWDLTMGQPVPADASPQLRDDIMKFHSTYASHVAVHMLDASTLTHGLNDSPIGMLAWLLQRWKKWSDKNADFDAVFSRDFVLTQATVFWVTQSIGTSIRMYRNTVRHPWTPSHDRRPVVEPPAGFTFLLGDVYPPGVRTVEERIAAFVHGPSYDSFNVVNVNAHPKGGHFGHFENPEAFVGDVRETFRKLR